MCDVAVTAGEKDNDRDDKFRFDGVEERQLAFELVSVSDCLRDHAGVAEWEHAIRRNAVRRTLYRDDVRQPDDARFGSCVMGGIRLTEDAGRRRNENKTSVPLRLHDAVRRLTQVEGAMKVHVD